MHVNQGLVSIVGRPNAVLTVGNFDGVHLGHQALVRSVVEGARKIGAESAVVTFDPHPSVVLRPESPVPQLFDRGDLVRQLEGLGVERVVFEPFDVAFSQLSAEEFAKRLLTAFHVRQMVVGYDFAFGHRREGGLEKLQAIAKQNSFSVLQVPASLADGRVVSSSAIRGAIASGDVELAKKLLGRAFSVRGKVEEGAGRGHKIGFPTLNIRARVAVIPKPGVYATVVDWGDGPRPGVTNVGVRPTFETDGALTIENHVFDFSGNIYGREVTLEFYHRLRDEMRFSSVDELKQAIARDILEAKNRFGG